MYRITLVCDGVPASAGEEAARDITQHFKAHYPHEGNAICSFDGESLRLVAENDHDPEGRNLMDEFSDVISANLEPFDGDIRLISLERVIEPLSVDRRHERGGMADIAEAFFRHFGEFGIESAYRRWGWLGGSAAFLAPFLIVAGLIAIAFYVPKG
jgi:hypothetical protein